MRFERFNLRLDTSRIKINNVCWYSLPNPDHDVSNRCALFYWYQIYPWLCWEMPKYTAPSNASFCTVHTSPDCAGKRSEFPKIAFYPHSHCSRCKKVTFCSIRLMLGFACWKLLKVLRRDSTLFRRKESEEFDSFRAMFVPDPRCAIIKQIALQPTPLALKFDFDIILYIWKRPTEYVIQPRVARNAPRLRYATSHRRAAYGQLPADQQIICCEISKIAQNRATNPTVSSSRLVCSEWALIP